MSVDGIVFRILTSVKDFRQIESQPKKGKKDSTPVRHLIFILSSLYACMTSMPVCFNQSDGSAAYQDDFMTSAFTLWSNKSGLSLPPQLLQKQKSWDTPLSIITLDNLVKN